MSSSYSKYNFGMFNPTNTIKSIHIVDIGFHDHTVVKTFSTKPRAQHYHMLHIVLEGQGSLYYKNKTYHLSPGTIFYLPPSIQHLYLPKTDNPYKFIWIGLDGQELPELFKKKNITESEPILHPKNVQKTLTLCKNFIENHTQKNITEEKMLSFFFSFIDSIRDQPNAFLSSTHPTKYVEHIKNLINSNYMLPTFPIHVLTNVLHLSHSYLCALFKKEMGMSMQQYLLTVRLNNASRLLIESDLPINEIAYSCGFNDALYFSAIFKKKGGLSPKDYRKKYAKKSKT